MLKKSLLLFVSADLNPFVDDTIRFLSGEFREEVEVGVITYFKPALLRELRGKTGLVLGSFMRGVLRPDYYGKVVKDVVEAYSRCLIESGRRSCVLHGLKELSFLGGLLDVVDKGRYEKVHVHAFWLYPAGHAGVVFRRLMRRKYMSGGVGFPSLSVMTMGFDIDQNTLSVPSLAAVSREVIWEADAVFVGDGELARPHVWRLCGRGCPGMLGSKVTVFRAFAPRVFFEPHPPIFRRIVENAIGDGSWRIVGFGPKLTKEYGGNLFVEALTYLPRSVLRKTVFLTAGLATPSMLSRLYKIREEHRAKIVHLGFVPFQYMPSFYSSLDFFVFLHPVHGISVLESMASGKPVVGRKGEITRIIHGKTGLLLEDDDPRHLAEHIEYLVETREETERMGRNAKRYAWNWHHPQKSLSPLVAKIKSYLD